MCSTRMNANVGVEIGRCVSTFEELHRESSGLGV